MALVHQYHSTVPAIRFIFKVGTVAHFIAGKFRTTNETEIAELDAEIKAGNPFIFIRTETKVVDTQDDDPLVGLKKKWLAEYQAENNAVAAKIEAGDTDFGGTFDTGVKLNPANSNTTQQTIATAKAATVVKPNK